RLLHAMALGGLAIGLIALAEATGAPVVQDWLAALHEGAVPIGDVPRVAATLSHPNEAAVLLELSLPLLVAWLWTTSSRWRPGLALATLCMLLALVLTFSRAGLAAGLTGLAVMGVSSLKHRQPRQLAALGTAALIVPLALTWASLADPGLERRLTAGLDEASAAQPARTEFWSVALAMLRDHPWLGVGPDNFRWDFAAYAGVPADNLGIHAHNQYLESLADTGLPGLLTFVWWLVALLRLAVERARATRPDWPYRAALLASLSAWLVHALMDDFERFWPASVAFWLLVGLSLGRAGAGAGAGPLARLAVEEPEDQADDRDYDEQDQDASRTAQRGSAAAPAEAHHERTLSVGRSGRIKGARAVRLGPRLG
ncbi:MAG TPA: O-antigen ligase family protein, partial [Chloroflexota bacterium]